MTDPLSEVLRSFRLRGSIAVNWDLGAPWGIAVEKVDHAPFHLVQSGTCVVVTAGGRRVDLGAGDIVVVFDGAAHRISDSANSPAEPLEKILSRGGDATRRTYGGSGARCRMVCGKFAIDGRESAPATLRHLPPLVHIPRAQSARVAAFSAALELLDVEMRRRESGSERAASLLTEVLLIQVIRAVLEGEDGAQAPGWLEGLRDPQIAAALAAVHGEPDEPWSLDSLAGRAGLSRSVFAARFAQRVGQTPMSYLARWRLQIAARRLRETSLTISEIFRDLGFSSAASFDRAFKRVHGISPSGYRRRNGNSHGVVEIGLPRST